MDEERTYLQGSRQGRGLPVLHALAGEEERVLRLGEGGEVRHGASTERLDQLPEVPGIGLRVVQLQVVVPFPVLRRGQEGGEVIHVTCVAKVRGDEAPVVVLGLQLLGLLGGRARTGLACGRRARGGGGRGRWDTGGGGGRCRRREKVRSGRGLLVLGRALEAEDGGGRGGGGGEGGGGLLARRRGGGLGFGLETGGRGGGLLCAGAASHGWLAWVGGWVVTVVVCVECVCV